MMNYDRTNESQLLDLYISFYICRDGAISNSCQYHALQLRIHSLHAPFRVNLRVRLSLISIALSCSCHDIAGIQNATYLYKKVF